MISKTGREFSAKEILAVVVAVLALVVNVSNYALGIFDIILSFIGTQCFTSYNLTCGNVNGSK